MWAISMMPRNEFTCSKSTIETTEKWVKFWTDFTCCPVLSVVDFEQVNTGLGGVFQTSMMDQTSDNDV